jgi:hypothetical protein
MDRHKEDDAVVREEITRRLTFLESKTKVLRERVAVEEARDRRDN